MTSTVLTRMSGPVAHIILNRPHRLNALNRTLLADFAAALQAVQADPSVAVIILRGEGRAFCAGDDLKDFDDQVGDDPSATRSTIEAIQDITRLLMLGDAIVIGAIHGWAVGGGLEWVINCDMTVMGEGCRCFFPEAELGVFVTGGVSMLLPATVGLQKAKELILLGEQFTAAEALAMGLVSRVIPDAMVLETAEALAARVAALPAIARRNVKRVLNRACTASLAEAMALETDATVEGFLDPGTRARVAARLA